MARAETENSLKLDQRTLMVIAQMIRKGTMKPAYKVTAITDYVRSGQRVAVFKEEPVMIDGVPSERTIKKFAGFEPKDEKIGDAFKVDFPNGSCIYLTADELAHFGLNKDGGLVDTETGEMITLDQDVSFAAFRS